MDNSEFKPFKRKLCWEEIGDWGFQYLLVSRKKCRNSQLGQKC
jgi:hypothetical protein